MFLRGNQDTVSRSLPRVKAPRRLPALREPVRVPAGNWDLPKAPPAEATSAAATPGTTMGHPITGPTDPRWILAVRPAELLDGAILRPEKRDCLTSIGTTLGLSLFDANLIIAIVQDQARRGYEPRFCPTAGEPQLRMVPLTITAKIGAAVRTKRAMELAWWIVGLLAIELIVLSWIFG